MSPAPPPVTVRPQNAPRHASQGVRRVLLDEPFSGLDPIAMSAMGELLSDVAAGRVTVLFSRTW